MWCLYNDHCLDIIMIIWSSINCPIVICLPTVCYLSREKPLVKPTVPGSSFSYICFAIYFIFSFYSDLLNQKYKTTLLHFILFAIYYFNLLQLSPVNTQFLAPYPERDWQPLLTRRVARCCYLCAGAVYVVLLGSPTGSITLVSFLREIPTTAVMHHPFLFGEILT